MFPAVVFFFSRYIQKSFSSFKDLCQALDNQPGQLQQGHDTSTAEGQHVEKEGWSCGGTPRPRGRSWQPHCYTSVPKHTTSPREGGHNNDRGGCPKSCSHPTHRLPKSSLHAYTSQDGFLWGLPCFLNNLSAKTMQLQLLWFIQPVHLVLGSPTSMHEGERWERSHHQHHVQQVMLATARHDQLQHAIHMFPQRWTQNKMFQRYGRRCSCKGLGRNHAHEKLSWYKSQIRFQSLNGGLARV